MFLHDFVRRRRGLEFFWRKCGMNRFRDLLRRQKGPSSLRWHRSEHPGQRFVSYFAAESCRFSGCAARWRRTREQGDAMIVRPASLADMQRVCDLYNALIPTSTIGWTEQLQTLPEREAWFRGQLEAGFPTIVADEHGKVIGFAAYSDFRGAGKWPGYRYTVEHTIHIDQRWWGRSVGRALLSALIDEAQASGVHVMIAAIDGDNQESVRFHERLGFTTTARLPEIGTKFGRWLDLVLMQRILDTGSPAER